MQTCTSSGKWRHIYKHMPFELYFKKPNSVYKRKPASVSACVNETLIRSFSAKVLIGVEKNKQS